MIDSDAAARGIVRSRLADVGHTVRLAEEAGLGIEAVLGGDHDGVLIAARLDEGTSGVDVCHNLRGHRELIDVPLVVYSLLDRSPEILPQALAAGAHAVVLPEQGTQLERIVEAALLSRQRVRDLRERQLALRHEHRRLTDAVSQPEEEGSGRLASPDAVLVVDGSGVVRGCDQEALSLFGRHCVGSGLPELAPETGFDTFARGARHGPRQGLRFDRQDADSGVGRALLAAAVPTLGDRRLVLLNERGKAPAIFEHARTATTTAHRRWLASLNEAAARVHSLERIPGDGPFGVRLRREIARASRSRDPVLLSGEPGTGRRFLGRVLHHRGGDTGPVHEVSCAALSPRNLEQELFGHRADAEDPIDRPGLLRLAKDGTVLIGEVERMPSDVRRRMTELLRRGPPARLVLLASPDRTAPAGRGELPPELAERLRGRRIDVPALRDRGGEIAGIVRATLASVGGTTLEPEAERALLAYSWPGNLAELEETLERGAHLAEGAPVGLGHLPDHLVELRERSPEDADPARPAGERYPEPPSPSWTIGEEDPISFEFYERQAILRALHACRGDRLAAARLLRLGKSTLYRKIRRFGIE